MLPPACQPCWTLCVTLQAVDFVLGPSSESDFCKNSEFIRSDLRDCQVASRLALNNLQFLMLVKLQTLFLIFFLIFFLNCLQLIITHGLAQSFSASSSLFCSCRFIFIFS